MRASALLLIISVLPYVGASAQSVITGNVTDEAGKPLPGISLCLREPGKSAIAEYTESGSDGGYRLSYSGLCDSLTVSLSGLGIKTQDRYVANRTQTVNFTATCSAIEIREVSVVADRITQRGDTLSYLVESFKMPTDRTIGDVMKNMPGLEVADNGTITFNGKSISNFYVENLDLLEGRYGIGTNNIRAADIASVQVYQDHKPVKAMKDWDPERHVAVNLTLKSERRNTFSLHGMAGAGVSPALWEGELAGMLFSKNFQTMNLYKGNNTGNDIITSGEFADHSGAVIAPVPGPELTLVQPETPKIPDRRYVFNRSNVYNTGSIVRLDFVSTLNVSATYSNDRVIGDGEYTELRLIADGGTDTVKQSIRTTTYTDDITAAVTYKKNADALYVSNSLTGNIKCNDGRGVSAYFVGNTAKNLRQHINNSPALSINDAFSFISNRGDRHFSLNLKAGYSRLPQSLSIEPASLLGVADKDSESISQRFTREQLRARAHTSLGYRFGGFHVSSSVFASAWLDNISSSLSGTNLEDPVANDYSTGRYTAGAEISSHADITRRLTLYVTLPLALDVQTEKDRLGRGSHSNTMLQSDPYFKLLYATLSQNISVSGVYNSHKDYSGYFEDGVIMRSYNRFTSREPGTWHGYRMYTAKAEYNYRNSRLELFGDANASFRHTRRNTLEYITYNGMITETRSIRHPNEGSAGDAGFNISKGISAVKSVVKVGGTGGFRRDWTIVQFKPVKYTAEYWFAKLSWAVQPLRWVSSTFTGMYGVQQNRIKHNSAMNDPIRQSTLRLDMTFLPAPAVDFSMGIEDSYNNLSVRDRHVWFGDIKAHWRSKLGEFGVQISNIFNRRYFTNTRFDGVVQYINNQRLRKRSILINWRFKII